MRERLHRLASELQAAVARRGPDWTPPGLTRPDLESLLEHARSGPDRLGDAEGADGGGRLARLARIFGLTELDVDLLAVTAGVDLDPTLCSLASAVGGMSRPDHVAVAAAFELAGQPATAPEARARLRPGAPLIANELLQVLDAGPLPFRRLRVPDRVLAHLLGDEDPEPALTAMTLDVPGIPDADPAVRLGRGILAGGQVSHVLDAAGTDGLATACGAFESVRIPSLAIDLSHRPAGLSLADAAGQAIREAGLSGAGLVVCGTAAADLPELLAILSRSPVPVVVVDRTRWAAEWTAFAPLTVMAAALDQPTRETLWRATLPESVTASPQWPDVLALALTAREIVHAGQAAVRAAAADGTELDLATVRTAARMQGTADLSASAHRRVPQATLADLIVPPVTGQALSELVGWARHREELLGRARLGGKGSKGSGVLALFAGPPGTGKTLAAEAVAGELGLELYTVELSAIIDKYIGETEKNLERIILAAESLNVVLFFDEADAIFGSRSAVKEAKDRYANQEVSYLLQRMESFSGLAILATNLRGNLDPAFSRRLHFIVPFTEPPPDIREQLWRSHLAAVPRLDPDDPADVGRLAAAVDLPGGGIKNIVMAAAFAAAPTGGGVGMRHLLAAADRELGKLGRRTTPRG